MENLIGLINIGSTETQIDLSIFEEKIMLHECSLLEVTDKKFVKKLDGLIINLEKDFSYVEAFQWLIDIQEESSFFIWVFCKHYNEEMVKLFLHLSKNSVIEVFDHKDGIEKLALSIKNAMSYKNYLKKETMVEKDEDGHYLDQKKLSLVVQGKSIYLTRMEFKLISMLYNRFEDVATYQEIKNELFQFEENDNVVRYRIANTIFRIREKLKTQKLLEVAIIRTKGYQLTYADLK